MKKLAKILKLSDPPPNLWYEISCYLKAILATTLVILGLFLIISPLFKIDLVIFGMSPVLGSLGEIILVIEERLFGQNFVLLSLIFGTLLIIFGFWLFSKIKLIKKIFKTLLKGE